MLGIMKILWGKLLLLSLCVMVMQRATSLPTELTTTQQTEEPLIPQVDVYAAVNGVMLAAQRTAVDGDGAVHAVDAPALPFLSADEHPPRGVKCVKVGEYCSLADDCCTKRCLTYAKKCVT